MFRLEGWRPVNGFRDSRTRQNAHNRAMTRPHRYDFLFGLLETGIRYFTVGQKFIPPIIGVLILVDPTELSPKARTEFSTQRRILRKSTV